MIDNIGCYLTVFVLVTDLNQTRARGDLDRQLLIKDSEEVLPLSPGASSRVAYIGRIGQVHEG